MPQISYDVSAKMHSAIQQFLSVAQAEGKATEGFKKLGKAGKEADSAIASLGKSARNFATGLIGLGSANAVLNSFFSTLKANATTLRQFEKDITGPLSEADNVYHIGQFKTQVLNLAEAFAITNKESADAISGIQNGLGHLGKAVEDKALRGVLELNEVLGMDMPQAVAYTTKAYQAFGKELEKDAAATDKLFKLANGLSGVENPAEFLAAISPYALAAGASLDSTSAAMQTFTTQGGKTKASTSAAIAMFKGIADAIEQGALPAAASFEEKLKLISKWEGTQVTQFFGSDSVQIQRFIKDLDPFIAKLKETAGAAGEVQKRLAWRLSDPAGSFARNMDQVETAQNNTVLRDPEWMAKFGPGMLDDAKAMLAYKVIAGPDSQAALNSELVPDFLAPKLAKFTMWLGGGSDLGSGMVEQNLGNTGKMLEADMEALRRGQPIGDPLHGFAELGRTGNQDASRYAGMRAQYGNRFTMAKYLKLRGYEVGVDRGDSPRSIGNASVADAAEDSRLAASRQQYRAGLGQYWSGLKDSINPGRAATRVQAKVAGMAAEAFPGVSLALSNVGKGIAAMTELAKAIQKRHVRIANPDHQE